MISDIRAAQREEHWLQASPATIGDYPFGAAALNLFGVKDVNLPSTRRRVSVTG
ncbi:hypothetical protein [Paenibacillus antibioticophila]|uniref:hypothetical protein n=1 Tax=Paenibacillus antibioticophila TaxID=1274374 RepID=UPI001BB32182|nr:hypothetical protein [Paenibacillus antibioticophila]